MDLEELVTYGCTSLAWVSKWFFLENQQSHSAWHSTATYHYQTFPNCEICIQILDQTAISTHRYHPASIKVQKRLRPSSPEIIHSSWISCQAAILFKELPGKQAASRLDRKNMAVLIVEGRIHQFVTTDS